MTALTELAACA
jgi:hypothetical protein